jgi:hypothetical protein
VGQPGGWGPAAEREGEKMGERVTVGHETVNEFELNQMVSNTIQTRSNLI